MANHLGMLTEKMQWTDSALMSREQLPLTWRTRKKLGKKHRRALRFKPIFSKKYCTAVIWSQSRELEPGALRFLEELEPPKIAVAPGSSSPNPLRPRDFFYIIDDMLFLRMNNFVHLRASSFDIYLSLILKIMFKSIHK